MENRLILPCRYQPSRLYDLLIDFKLDPYSMIGFFLLLIGSIFILSIFVFIVLIEFFSIPFPSYINVIIFGAILFPSGMFISFNSPFFTNYERLAARAKKYNIKIHPLDLGS